MGTACSVDRTAEKEQTTTEVRPSLGPLVAGVAQGRQAREWQKRYVDEVNSGPNIAPEDGPFPISIEGLSAKALGSSDLGGLADPFCVVTLRNSKKTTVATKKTEVIKRKIDPTWRTNIRFPLSVTGSELADHSLKFEIFDWDKGSSPDLLGQYVLELSTLSSPTKSQKTTGDLTAGQNQKKTATGTVSFSISYEEGLQAEAEPTEEERKKAQAELDTLRPWFGLHLKPGNLQVTVTEENSPPRFANPPLQKGDQIITTNGVSTTNTQEFGKVASKLKAGQKVHVQFLRERRVGTLEDGKLPQMQSIMINTVIEVGGRNKEGIFQVPQLRRLRKRAGIPWETDREVMTRTLQELDAK